jgi:hypothetical protein
MYIMDGVDEPLLLGVVGEGEGGLEGGGAPPPITWIGADTRSGTSSFTIMIIGVIEGADVI